MPPVRHSGWQRRRDERLDVRLDERLNEESRRTLRRAASNAEGGLWYFRPLRLRSPFGREGHLPSRVANAFDPAESPPDGHLIRDTMKDWPDEMPA